MKRFKKELDLLIEINGQHTTKRGRPLTWFFMSMDHFQKEYNHKYGKNAGKGNLNKKLAYLTLLGVIEKRLPTQLPEGMKHIGQGLMEKAAREKKKPPIFYKINKLGIRKLKQVDKKVQELKDKGVTIQRCTYENLTSILDSKTASRAFPSRSVHKVSTKTLEGQSRAISLVQSLDIISITEVKEHLISVGISKARAENISKSLQVDGYKVTRYTKDLKNLGEYKINQRVFVRSDLICRSLHK